MIEVIKAAFDCAEFKWTPQEWRTWLDEAWCAPEPEPMPVALVQAAWHRLTALFIFKHSDFFERKRIYGQATVH